MPNNILLLSIVLLLSFQNTLANKENYVPSQRSENILHILTNYEALKNHCVTVRNVIMEINRNRTQQVQLYKSMTHPINNDIEKMYQQLISCKNHIINKIEIEASPLISNLNTTISEATSTLNIQNQKIVELTEQLSRRTAELDEANNIIKVLNSSNADNNNTIANQLKSIAIFKKQIDDDILIIGKLSSNATKMAEQIETFKSEQSSNADRIKTLTSAIDSFSTCCQFSSCVPFGDSNYVHIIKVSGYQEPFNVLCNGKSAAGLGWTVIQRRINGSVDFYRNWSEYKEGFGDLNGEFFIGLEKLHHMTTAEKQELYIHLEDFDGESRYAKYDNFIVGTEQESYALKSLGNYAGNAENAMRLNKGVKFSTRDRDNDNDPDVHCAEKFQGAWWYNMCGLINLNGIYQIADDNYDEGGKGIFWDTDSWHQSDYSMKSVEIMIRPRNARKVN